MNLSLKSLWPLRHAICGSLTAQFHSKQAKQLKEKIRRQQRSNLPVVIGRRNFYQITSHQFESFETADEIENLSARKSSHLGRARTRRKSRVHDVNVQGDVRGTTS